MAALQQGTAHQHHRKGRILPQQAPHPQHLGRLALLGRGRRRQRIAEGDLHRQRRQQHRQDHRGTAALQHKAHHQRHDGIGGGAGAPADAVVDVDTPQVVLHHHAVEEGRRTHQRHADDGVASQQHRLVLRQQHHGHRRRQRDQRQHQRQAAAGPPGIGVRQGGQRWLDQQRQHQRQGRDHAQRAVAQPMVQQQHRPEAPYGGESGKIAALHHGMVNIHLSGKLVHSASCHGSCEIQ